MATFTATESHVTCPDCGGTGNIRVILYDDTAQARIEYHTAQLAIANVNAKSERKQKADAIAGDGAQ